MISFLPMLELVSLFCFYLFHTFYMICIIAHTVAHKRLVKLWCVYNRETNKTLKPVKAATGGDAPMSLGIRCKYKPC